MSAQAENRDYVVAHLPMEEIFLDEDFNCRGRIAPIDVVDLAKSIAADGLQQPIVVQPLSNPAMPQYKYRIVAGHRRYTAFRVNKAQTIPAFVRQGLDEMSARLLNLTENLKREELNILQEARALVPFKRAGWSELLMSAKTGMSRGWVQVRLMLLSMPEAIQKEAAAGLLTQDQIRKLYGMENDEKRFAAVRLIKERREKGESTALTPPKSMKPHDKRIQTDTSISLLQEYIQDQVGNNIATRILGWCTGNVTNLEIHRDLREFFAEQGEEYRIPKELLQ